MSTPDASQMSTDGLYDAALGSIVAMLHEENFAKRVEHKRWTLDYVRELKRRAAKYEHELTMLRLSK
jgi:hypothetical protein